MDPTGQDIRFMEMKDAINKLNNCQLPEIFNPQTQRSIYSSS